MSKKMFKKKKKKHIVLLKGHVTATNVAADNVVQHRKEVRLKPRALVFGVIHHRASGGGRRRTIYIRCVSVPRGSAQDALRGSRLRHPIFGTQQKVGRERRGGRGGREERKGPSARRPITLFTIRTAIISWQQSEPAGFSIVSARVYTPPV